MNETKTWSAMPKVGPAMVATGHNLPSAVVRQEVTAASLLDDIEAALFKAGLLAGRINGAVGGAGKATAGDGKPVATPTLMARLHDLRTALREHVGDLRMAAENLGAGAGDIEV